MLTTLECSKIATNLNERFSIYLSERYFLVSTKQEPDHLEVEVLLRNASGEFFYPVCGRCRLGKDIDESKERVLGLLDYISVYFDEFLKNDEGVYLPIDWSDYEFDGLEFQLKGQILNLKLEKMADEWLKNPPPREDFN